MTLTVGSLFSGIGGIDLGLERAGMRVLWQVEIDPWCRRVLEKHWPDVERFEDVRSVGAGSLAPVDLIAGGFPCQDISYAGQGIGIAGARSGLWSEYARLVRELRPRYVLVENVPALLTRGLGVVLGDLAAIGYDAEWDCIPASAVGAPHRRDRIWVVAYPKSHLRRAPRHEGHEPPDGRGPDVADTDAERLQERWLHEVGRAEVPDLAGSGGGDEALADAARNRRGQGRSRRPDRSGEGSSVQPSAQVVADTDGSRLQGLRAEPELGGDRRQESTCGGRSGAGAMADTERDGLEKPRDDGIPRGSSGPASDAGWWATEPDVGRVAHGVPARVDRLRGLGNAVVPQVVEWIGKRIVEAEEAA